MSARAFNSTSTIRLRAVVNPAMWTCTLLILAVAIVFRCRDLGTIPGVNGDEAWYGNLVHDIFDGRPRFLTPSRIPINPFYIAPALSTHLIMDDSVTALRVPALLSGLAALVLNFWLMSRQIGRATAVSSTLLLAVLPIMIAYSRFGWDMSQMPLAAVIVLHTALRAHCDPTSRNVRLAWLALLASLLVHPTALFLAPFTFFATAGVLMADMPFIARGLALMPRSVRRHELTALTVLTGLMVVAIEDWRLGSLLPMNSVARLREFVSLFGDLFTGRTVFRYLVNPETGSVLWTAGACFVVVATSLAVWKLRASRDDSDQLLSRAFVWGLAAFFIAGGPRAMSPGYERYAVFLIVPVVMLWSRAIALRHRPCVGGSTASALLRGGSNIDESVAHKPVNHWGEPSGVWGRRVPMGAGLVFCAALLGAFQTHYFDQLHETGGTAAMTFRTNAHGLHAEAARTIVELSAGEPCTVITADFHCEQPLRYLLAACSDIVVLRVEDATSFESAVRQSRGRTWVVDFAADEHGESSQLLQSVMADLARLFTFNDACGRLAIVAFEVNADGRLTLVD